MSIFKKRNTKKILKEIKMLNIKNEGNGIVLFLKIDKLNTYTIEEIEEIHTSIRKKYKDITTLIVYEDISNVGIRSLDKTIKYLQDLKIKLILKNKEK